MHTIKDFTKLISPHTEHNQFNILISTLQPVKWSILHMNLFIRAFELVKKEKKVTFPYKRYYMKKPEVYYANLLQYQPKVIMGQAYSIYRNIISETGKFQELYPIPFKNKDYLYFGMDPADYEKINILPDYFTEKPRIESTGHGETISPMEFWNYGSAQLLLGLLANNKDINTYNLREEIYRHIKEARQGKTTVYYSLYKYFNSKKVLDMACAWGDRLIAAIATNVDTYYGIDPNKDLIEGHQQIINKFASDKTKYHMIYEPFEQVKLPEIKFDFIYFSPPPFYGDVYGNKEGQSITSFPDFEDWFVNFMLFCCYKAYKHLDNKGWFLITVLDRLYPEKYAIVELLNLSMEYKCKKLFYRGVIGWQGDNKSITPNWAWKIRKKDPNPKIERAKNLLEKYYPKIFQKIKEVDYKKILIT